MAKIQSVWALDIGQSALKALKLVPGDQPGQVIAEAFDFVEYPKILSQPDAEPEELVQAAMSTFLERNDVKGSRVAIGVPGQTGLVKFIKLPPVEKKRIPDIVKFEARQQIPFALEEVIWDWQEIPTDDDEDDDFAQTEVGLFAMKREQIHRAIQPFQSTGIEVDIVQMSPIALYNYIAFDRINTPPGEEPKEGEGTPADGERESVVLLDIGADHTDLIITDGQRIWQRNVPIGGNHFTRSLTKDLKLTFAKAEHLKRNATKAPDPRAVFTAMRGVFGDFASEIQRSIGFYGSVNRQAKVTKVIGLGNGFKLPGLQKFLQQKLSQDVEKLERYDRLIGEEVLEAPQFQENLASFAVAYGLALQALDLGGMQTNLLPQEILQTRLVRAKKPWALVAAALLLLGFSALYLGNYRALAKVDNPEFEQAVSAANNAKKLGDGFDQDYSQAVSKFGSVKQEGEQLVAADITKYNFKRLLQRLSQVLYDPKIDPEFQDVNFDELANRIIYEQHQVHIDAIRPVYRNDLSQWFESLKDLEQKPIATMHPYDQETPPPAEAGWVIEIVGHHYNPLGEDLEGGPFFFLTERVIPRFWDIPFRQFGFSHACLRWFVTDKKWESQKALANNGIPSGAPQLEHSKPTTTGAARPGGGSGMLGLEEGMMDQMMGMGGMTGEMSGGRGGMEGMDGMDEMMAAMMGGGMMGGRTSAFGSSVEDENIEYATRTDFVLLISWAPPTEDGAPVTAEDLRTKLAEAEAKYDDSIKTPDIIKAFEDASSQETTEAIAQSVQNASGSGAIPSNPSGTPGNVPPASNP